MKKIFGALIVLIFSGSLYGQQIETCDSVTSFWIIEKDNTYYSLKLNGDVEVTNKESIISINDYVLQYNIVGKDKYTTGGKKLKEIDILLNYVSSELKYISGQFKTELETMAQKAPLSEDKDVVIWWYKMPEGMNEQVINQLFACIIIDDKIFGIGSPQFTDQNFGQIRDFLMDEISTLKNVK